MKIRELGKALTASALLVSLCACAKEEETVETERIEYDILLENGGTYELEAGEAVDAALDLTDCGMKIDEIDNVGVVSDDYVLIETAVFDGDAFYPMEMVEQDGMLLQPAVLTGLEDGVGEISFEIYKSGADPEPENVIYAFTAEIIVGKGEEAAATPEPTPTPETVSIPKTIEEYVSFTVPEGWELEDHRSNSSWELCEGGELYARGGAHYSMRTQYVDEGSMDEILSRYRYEYNENNNTSIENYEYAEADFENDVFIGRVYIITYEVDTSWCVQKYMDRYLVCTKKDQIDQKPLVYMIGSFTLDDKLTNYEGLTEGYEALKEQFLPEVEAFEQSFGNPN